MSLQTTRMLSFWIWINQRTIWTPIGRPRNVYPTWFSLSFFFYLFICLLCDFYHAIHSVEPVEPFQADKKTHFPSQRSFVMYNLQTPTGFSKRQITLFIEPGDITLKLNLPSLSLHIWVPFPFLFPCVSESLSVLS